MKKFDRFFLTIILIVVLTVGLYYFASWFSETTGYAAGEDEKVKLAKCLSSKGAELYCSIYSVDCENQMSFFGSASKFVQYVECGKNMELCRNIREVPAWYVNKSPYYGLRNVSELRELSGCE